jgi:hypothetical protein
MDEDEGEAIGALTELSFKLGKQQKKVKVKLCRGKELKK